MSANPAAAVRSIVDKAERYQPVQEPDPTEVERPGGPKKRSPLADDEGGLDLTDTGNARRLIEQADSRLRFVVESKEWLYCGESNVWKRDRNGERVRQAQKAARNLLMLAASATRVDIADKIAKHGLRAQNLVAINAAIELAKAEPGVTVSVDDLDADPWSLSCTNGLVPLKTGSLRQRLAGDLITKSAACNYVATAKCPRFEAFLLEVMGGRAEMVAFIRRLVGYSLLGANPEQVLVLFVGVGANGKSTLLDVLIQILGDYAQTTPAESFMQRREGAPTNDLARLRGARLVSATEAEQGRRLAEALVKRLTGSDRIAARFLFAEFFEYVPAFLAFLAVNHKPIVTGDDPAIWRRLLVIPFDVVIPPEKRDKRLVEKLLLEREGILAWAVRGCLEWQRDGLQVPDVCLAAASEYRQSMDTLGSWLEERTLAATGVSAKANELYKDYDAWCSSNGHSALNSTRFGLALGERGLDKVRAATGFVYRGIGLLSTDRGDQ